MIVSAKRISTDPSYSAALVHAMQDCQKLAVYPDDVMDWYDDDL